MKYGYLLIGQSQLLTHVVTFNWFLVYILQYFMLVGDEEITCTLF
jgi:hypothetical protein